MTKIRSKKLKKFKIPPLPTFGKGLGRIENTGKLLARFFKA